ncbi:MAG: DASS family sodium-coupled anion symporter [Verrucomicrobiota bacterium]
MFRPFFRRRRTWLVFTGLGLFLGLVFLLPMGWPSHAGEGLEAGKVCLGLGIFALVAFLWLTEALPLAATALLVPVLASGSGLLSVPSALASFAHPLIFLFLGGFALAAALAYQGLDRWIANRLIRLGGGQFLWAALWLFGATAGLSMWMSNTATTAMMIPLVLGVLRRLEAEAPGQPTSSQGLFLLLGVAYAASIGGLGTIVGSPPNGVAAEKLGLGFLEWMAIGLPAVGLLLPVMVGVLFCLLRPKTEVSLAMEEAPFRLNWHRWVTLLLFAVTALSWVFSQQIAGWLGIAKGVDTVIALMAVVALLYFRVVRWRDIDRATDWGVLLLFGGGLALSSVLKESGASLFLARVFVEGVQGWPLFLLVGAVVAFVIFLTELSSNTATAALLVPIFYTVALELELAGGVFVVPLALAASCAFMLPVATPPNAIVFGTGRVPQRQMMRVGLVLNLVSIAILTGWSTLHA